MLSAHPIFWLLVAAVVAPLLAEIPLGFKVPVVVLEVVLGIVIGPHVLGLVQFEGFVMTMFTIGMAATLFMAGMELDFSEIKGRPLSLAVGGWIVSVLLGITVVGILHVIPQVHAPLMVTLALSTTGLGVLVPVFRDGGQLETPFGRLFMAAGTLGEIGPIVAMWLLLSTQYSSWQETGFLFALLAIVGMAIVGMAIVVGMKARPSKLLALAVPSTLDHRGHHRNRGTGGADEPRRRGRSDWGRAAFRFAVPDDCRCHLATDCHAAGRWEFTMTVHPPPSVLPQ